MELSQLLFVSHLRENYCHAQCIFDFLEVPENQMQIKCPDPAQHFHSTEQETILKYALSEKRLVIPLIYWEKKNKTKTNKIKYVWADFEKE